MADVVQKITFKRGTKAALEAKLIGTNKPLKGEPIFESDTNKFKIGNGISDYKDLPYISGGEGPNEYIKSASVSGNKLTLVKQDGTSVVFEPEGVVYTAGDGIEITENTINVDNTIARQEALQAEAATRQTKDTELSNRIDALEGRGRFLSSWNAETGLPGDYPSIEIGQTYNYKAGDYYLVSKKGTTNKRPSGAGITRTSTGYVVGSEPELNEVSVGDQYIYSTTGWSLIHTEQKTATWGSIGGTLSEQTDLQNALDAKQNLISETNKLNSDLIDDIGRTNLFVNSDEKLEIAKIQNKADSTELQAEVSRATSAEDALRTDLDLKAEKSYVDTKLEDKADKTELLAKADKTYVDTELLNKADVIDLQNEITRAQQAESNLELQINQKADTTYVDTQVASEASLREQADTILQANIDQKSTVSVNSTGSSLTEVSYITIDGTEYKLAGGGGGGSPAVVTQKICENGADHNAILETITVKKQGDIAIIKEAIDDEVSKATKWQYTAYVYTGSVWAAMDGNYNAENVFFAKDLTYTKAIGELPAVPSTGSATLAAKGKNVKQIFDSILAKESYPTATQPSITINSTNIGEKEAGTKVSIAYTTTFSAGSYTYGPATGITASDYKVKFNNETLTTATGTFTELQVTDSTSLKITGTFDHTQGTVPVTNLGNPYPSKQIAAGNDVAMKEKGTLSGYRKMFYGIRTDKTELTSDKIRALTGEKQAAKEVNVAISVGALRVIIAVPSNRTVTSIKDVNGMSAEILSSFTQTTLNVEGANGYSAVSYKIYYLDYAEAIAKANTYKVTIV